MPPTPMVDDFSRKLSAIRNYTRDAAYRDGQWIREYYTDIGPGRSGQLINEIAERFDLLHEDAVEASMIVINHFDETTPFSLNELAEFARPTLEVIAKELVNWIQFLGQESLNEARDQARARSQDKFKKRLDETFRKIQIGFV